MSFRRICGTGFLSGCSPRIRRFYEYWNGKRGGRAMPSRADIDPAEIKDLLPGIILIDVRHDPLKLTYRLVGTNEVTARGSDPTGRDVATAIYAENPEEALRSYELVIKTRDVVYHEEPGETRSPQLSEVGLLATPLSSDGVTIDKLFVFVDYTRE